MQPGVRAKSRRLTACGQLCPASSADVETRFNTRAVNALHINQEVDLVGSTGYVTASSYMVDTVI